MRVIASDCHQVGSRCVAVGQLWGSAQMILARDPQLIGTKAGAQYGTSWLVCSTRG